MSKVRGKMERRKYTAEYQQEAVELVVSLGISTAQAAEDLGIGKSTLERWVSVYKSQHPEEKPLTLSEREELRQLRKEIQTVRMERDFLKKTAAFFARSTI